jgi:hypothetical protein
MKPVIEVTVDTMNDYEYAAKHHGRKGLEIIASDSLTKLKNECRDRGWRIAYITTRSGALSYGQSIVDEYPYCPRF